jgi:DNA-directed RNA polymerase subunit beta'
MLRTLEHNQGKREYNPVWLMVDSGARAIVNRCGNWRGVRGLMAKPSGYYRETHSGKFPRGLTVLGILI